MEPLPAIPVSAIEHHEYCPRQCILIHGDGVWADNAHTVRGQWGHRRVDSPEQTLERGARILRAVPLWSEQLGLSGRADAILIRAAEDVAPVEYKIGVRHGRAAELQLCAQALCLEEMLGIAIPVGYVWYSGPRRRETVQIGDELRHQTLTSIEAIRAMLADRMLPAAPNDARCDQCQLLAHCVPSLVAAPIRVADYFAREVMACGS